jgi:flagellar hook-basal body protein
LVTNGGLAVQSDTGAKLTIPADATEVRFDGSGRLMITDATGAERVLGRLGLAQFANSAGLQANGQNLWTATAASGAAVAIPQGAPNAPLMVGGALEGSNIDMADEFTRMIQAQRGYQMNSKVVQAWDDIQRMANELKSA